MFDAAVASVEPARLVAKHLHRLHTTAVLTDGGSSWNWPLPLHVIGAGKASARMARGVEDCIGAEFVDGVVAGPPGNDPPLGPRKIGFALSSHPVPDERSVAASQQLLDLASSCHDGTLCCLISGGASSLLALPAAGLSLGDKQETTQLLLRCGASIDEFNTVRKHISGIKGGGLLRAAARPMFTLVISDVVGDDVATIGSGPSVADPTTFSDAWRIITKYNLETHLPARIRAHLEAGLCGQSIETLKPGDKPSGPAIVIGSNQVALQGAADAAATLGWRPVILRAPLRGDTTAAARHFTQELLSCREGNSKGICVLAGGETTVNVRGHGRGGRNQEFALAAAASLAGSTAVLLSAGTDGIDGPTDAAGGFVDGSSATRAAALGISIEAALSNNDSYPCLEALEDLVRCGPTGTNVMDIKIGLLPA